MTQKFTNSVLGRAQQQALSSGQPRLGTIASYDPKTGLVTVIIEPDGHLTGWIPVSAIAVGQGTMRIAPTTGDQCLLIPQEGDNNSLIVVGFLHSQSSRPPQAADAVRGSAAELRSGEGLWTGPRGQFIRMNSNGSVLLKADQFNVEGAVHVTGDITCEGAVRAEGNVESEAQVIDLEGKLSELRDNYNDHQHPVGGAGSKITLKTHKPD